VFVRIYIHNQRGAQKQAFLTLVAVQKFVVAQDVPVQGGGKDSHTNNSVISINGSFGGSDSASNELPVTTILHVVIYGNVEVSIGVTRICISYTSTFDADVGSSIGDIINIVRSIVTKFGNGVNNSYDIESNTLVKYIVRMSPTLHTAF
jgi:hypothetical protein